MTPTQNVRLMTRHTPATVEVSGEGRTVSLCLLTGGLWGGPGLLGSVARGPPPARAAGSWCRGRAHAWGWAVGVWASPGPRVPPTLATTMALPSGAQRSLLSAEELVPSFQVNLELSACFQKVLCSLYLGPRRTQGRPVQWVGKGAGPQSER